MADIRWAGYPTVVVYEQATGSEPVTHLLWGDWLEVKGAPQNGRLPVRARGKSGWVKVDGLQEERLLEVVFVDIGQGDGLLMVTPEDRHLLIDAGESDNMYRFLRWRFAGFQRPFTFEAAIISHPDKDHYGGFAPIFADPNVEFETIYHNGLVERAGSDTDSLGARRKAGNRLYVTDLVTDTAAMTALLSNSAAVGGKLYPKLLKGVLDSGRAGAFQMLEGPRQRGERRFVPGYEEGKELSLEVLGPVAEEVDGVSGLRWFHDPGKTKNGHSVVLKLRYRDVTLLLGGDLNVPAEEWLLSHHTGLPCPPRDAVAEETLLAAARPVFACDVAKACHHGSSDFTDWYLRAVQPLATVISSGDQEGYAHPRADALGAAGRCGRGARPLIFSTELARSASERIKRPNEYRQRLLDLVDELVQAAGTAKAAELRRELEEEFGDIERSVAVYGAINLRSDGRRLLMAYKIEKPRRLDQKWDVYCFEPDAAGRLQLVTEGAD